MPLRFVQHAMARFLLHRDRCCRIVAEHADLHRTLRCLHREGCTAAGQRRCSVRGPAAILPQEGTEDQMADETVVANLILPAVARQCGAEGSGIAGQC